MYEHPTTAILAAAQTAGVDEYSSHRQLAAFLRTLTADQREWLAIQHLDALFRGSSRRSANSIRDEIVRRSPADKNEPLPAPIPRVSFAEREAKRAKGRAHLAAIVDRLASKADFGTFISDEYTDAYLDSTIRIANFNGKSVRISRGQATVAHWEAWKGERMGQISGEMKNVAEANRNIAEIKSRGTANLDEAKGRSLPVPA